MASTLNKDKHGNNRRHDAQIPGVNNNNIQMQSVNGQQGADLASNGARKPNHAQLNK